MAPMFNLMEAVLIYIVQQGRLDMLLGRTVDKFPKNYRFMDGLAQQMEESNALIRLVPKFLNRRMEKSNYEFHLEQMLKCQTGIERLVQQNDGNKIAARHPVQPFTSEGQVTESRTGFIEVSIIQKTSCNAECLHCEK